jgi:beta-mannosidase
VEAALLRHRSVELCFDGLDTVATVLLNGRVVHSTSNMFRRATVDVRHALVAGSNRLDVRFASPALAAAAYHDRYPYELPVTDPSDEIPYRNYLRKAQSDFAWDWGPGFAPSGIWKPVELRAFDEAIITDLTFIASREGSGSGWTANVTVYVRVSNTSQSGNITASVAGASKTQSVTLRACDPADGDEVAVVSLMLHVDQPELWWPVGYGSPSLYTLSVMWTGSTEKQTVTKRVGFRSIRVVREQTPPDQPGRSMLFQVNGVPVFAKGSNLVPFDAFHPRVTVENITRMMESALLSHQNIIRIWSAQPPAALPRAVHLSLVLPDPFSSLFFPSLLRCAQGWRHLPGRCCV